MQVKEKNKSYRNVMLITNKQMFAGQQDNMNSNTTVKRLIETEPDPVKKLAIEDELVKV